MALNPNILPVAKKYYDVPFYDAAAVTKSDSTIIPATRGLYIGGVGDLIVTLTSGATPITYKAVPAGTLLMLSVTQVLNATTATSIVALY